MLKDYFVKQGIKESQIEDFIRRSFPLGDYSRTELQKTPLGIKIIIYTNKPGRIIGRGGKNINEITEAIKNHFKLENPQVDVKLIDKPDLDAHIVAKQITSALERGYNYKKIGNLVIKRVMDAGAIGAQIVISGKLGGGKGITGKFVEGYIKHCGHLSKELVDEAFEEAQTRPGKIGVRVKIMAQFEDISGDRRTKEEIEKKEIVEELEMEEARKEKKEETPKKKKEEAKPEDKKKPTKKETKKPKKKKAKKEKPAKKEKVSPKKDVDKEEKPAKKKPEKKEKPKEKKAKAKK